MRRIYYIPGWISLLLLPVFCIQYLNKFNHKERFIELNFAERYDPHNIEKEEYRKPFDTTMLSTPENIRNYEFIELDSNRVDNKKKLNLFRDKVKKIILTNDTVNGIHLRFGKGSKLGEYIEAINISAFSDTVNIYIPFENNLWYLHKNFDPGFTLKTWNWKKEWAIKRKKSGEKLKMKRTIELSNETFSVRLNEAIILWPCLILLFLLGGISVYSNQKK